MKRVELTKNQYVALEDTFILMGAKLVTGEYEGSSYTLGDRLFLCQSDSAYWLLADGEDHSEIKEKFQDYQDRMDYPDNHIDDEVYLGYPD